MPRRCTRKGERYSHLLFPPKINNMLKDLRIISGIFKKGGKLKISQYCEPFYSLGHRLQIFFYMPRLSTRKCEHFSHLNFISKIIHQLIDLQTISSIFKNKSKSWKIKNLSILRFFLFPLRRFLQGINIYNDNVHGKANILLKLFLPPSHHPPKFVISPTKRSEVGLY